MKSIRIVLSRSWDDQVMVTIHDGSDPRGESHGFGHVSRLPSRREDVLDLVRRQLDALAQEPRRQGPRAA